MKLNLEYYKEDLYYNKTENEDKIIKGYINNYSEDEYEEKLYNTDIDFDISNLTEIRKNIISWYPFKENSEILEIGAGLGEITGELCKNNNKVTAIEFSKKRGEAIARRHKEKEKLEIIIRKFKRYCIK